MRCTLLFSFHSAPASDFPPRLTLFSDSTQPNQSLSERGNKRERESEFTDASPCHRLSVRCAEFLSDFSVRPSVRYHHPPPPPLPEQQASQLLLHRIQPRSAGCSHHSKATHIESANASRSQRHLPPYHHILILTSFTFLSLSIDLAMTQRLL